MKPAVLAGELTRGNIPQMSGSAGNPEPAGRQFRLGDCAIVALFAAMLRQSEPNKSLGARAVGGAEQIIKIFLEILDRGTIDGVPMGCLITAHRSDGEEERHYAENDELLANFLR